MATRTDGKAENYLRKIHNAIVTGGYGEFLSKNLGELSRIAPEEDHPAEWAIIQNGTDKPCAAVNAVYELVCQYTDERLTPDVEEDLARHVDAE